MAVLVTAIHAGRLHGARWKNSFKPAPYGGVTAWMRGTSPRMTVVVSYTPRGRRKSSVVGNSPVTSSGGSQIAPGVWPWSWNRANRRASAS